MDRVKKYSHKGKTILVIDFSGCAGVDIINIMDEAEKVIATFPPKKALLVSDVTGAAYSKEVAERMKVFSKNNTPYVLGSTAVGVTGVAGVLLQTLIFLTRREIKVFATRQAAMDWLVTL